LLATDERQQMTENEPAVLRGTGRDAAKVTPKLLGPMNYQVLTDDDVDSLLPMADAVASLESAFEQHAAGELAAPPRFGVDADGGSLVFTAGVTGGSDSAAGFRVYETFPDDGPGHEQLVASFDGETGAFEGVAVGYRIGAMRTGAIGGVAIDHLAREDATTLGILGSGAQARTQLEAATTVWEFDAVRVYSPTPDHREQFASEMSERLGVAIEATDGPEPVVRDADVLVCATRSTEPVFDSGWLRPGTHVNTLGPKLVNAHELDPAVAEQATVVATDSLAQVEGYDRPFFLAGTPAMDDLVELGDVVAGDQPGRTNLEDVTLFCSVGLAGTEVVLASEAFGRADEQAGE
jgi:ornithine cyclodeaminase/alanine dehydrogenase-like protein (mu-crystallin family)